MMMNHSEAPVLGVSGRWISRKKVITDLRDHIPSNIDVLLVQAMNAVIAYNARLDSKNDINVVQGLGYLVMGARRHREAIAAVLENSAGWNSKLAEAISYRMLSDRLDYFWHHQFDILFVGHKQPLASLSFASMTESMALSFMFGWTGQAIFQGYLTYATLNCQYQLILEYTESHRRAHAFMLRLFADWRGDQGLKHDWPAWGFDVPVYNGILERWREPDPSILAPWLLAACDRHTHEGRYDTSKSFYDFGDYRTTRTPLEIMLVFRLRELIGLTNPHLDHPLMAPPFDRLPEPQPVFEPDELMQATLKRTREDWPRFEEITSLQALMRHPSKPGRLR